MNGQEDAHIAALETRVTAVEKSVMQIAEDQRAGFAEVRGELAAIASNLNTRTRTDWQTLAGWASVVVVVIAAVGSLAYTPLALSLSELRSNFRQHEQMDGHPTAITKFTALEKNHEDITEKLEQEINQLDTNLQREMRDLDSGSREATDAKMLALDEKLQIEVTAVLERLSERIAGLERLVLERKGGNE